MKVLFFDIETTGFSREWDYIIEIAAILYDTETKTEIDRFHEYIKPGKKISDKIIKITGITNYKVANCRSEDDVLRDFYEFVIMSNPDVLGGHNIDAFDVNFVNKRLARYFLDTISFKTIDTLKLARKLKPPVGMATATGRPSYKQESIAMGFGIEYQAHSAIEDVKANIEIYFRMLAMEAERESKVRTKLGF